MQNAPREHSAILSTFIKLPFDFKTFVLSIFEWPLKIGFTVLSIFTNQTICFWCIKETSQGDVSFMHQNISFY